ncbi:hypothetical protein CVT25_010482 [Psilocybe cyanescens]|uniref:Nephrocystin 3-like N-terminal domain-containing protein n=1 Tax=Psilocybe cyanescens TaxID=93625 RepID=A0A409XDG1_PSICY|nr:hypothetical protein CVT25_010482 [Psilocybe cyanescens]
MDWVTDSARQEQFLWIYGPAGSGKSSIAQTVAEYCEQKGLLASDYFFSRTAPGRNTDTNLVPTLACQLTVSIPDICAHVAAAIRSDSLIFSRSLQTQLDALVVRPFAQCVLASKHNKGNAYPNLIIIDGLDECQPPDSQRHILSSLSSACRNSSIPIIFLLASRPEQTIREVFNGELNVHTRRLVLDDKYYPNKDIEIYLHSKFGDIKRNHPLALHIPVDWPSTSDVEFWKTCTLL